MTIAVNDRLIMLSPAAGTISLAFDFPLVSQAALVVYRLRDGEQAMLTLDGDYSFPSGLGGDAGGTIELAAASLDGDAFVLLGMEPIASDSDFALGLNFSAAKLNAAFDGFTRKLQEMRRDVSQAFRLPFGSDVDAQLPALEEGRTIMWDAANSRFVQGPSADQIETAHEIAVEIAANESAAEANADRAEAAADAAVTIAQQMAGGSVGFLPGQGYDFGSIADPVTYFNRDFGSIT